MEVRKNADALYSSLLTKLPAKSDLAVVGYQNVLATFSLNRQFGEIQVIHRKMLFMRFVSELARIWQSVNEYAITAHVIFRKLILKS